MLKTVLFVAFAANILLLVSASAANNVSHSSTNARRPRCGKLEVPDSCANGGCYKERKCTDILRSFICVDVIECKPGCLCKDGYLRNERGKCVVRNQCPQKLKCPRQNEVYYSCLDNCVPKTCESIGKQYNCPFKSANETCTGSCDCEPGYYRNINGDCISEENCKKCTGPNEYYDCGVACDNVCKTLSVRNQTNCDIINVKCNEMCYCVEGYARDENETCVPFDQCPGKAPTCGINEIYSNCINGGCFGAKTCEEVGNGIKCVKIDPKYCIKGCKCKDGYVKDKNGTCICEDQCPKKPPTCGINEIYSDCTNGGCFGAKTCEEVGNVGIKCVKIDPKYCIKGCKCKEGYVKDKNGTCIYEGQCPKKPPSCGINEIYSDCTNGGCFGAKTCEEVGNVGIKCVKIDPKYCIKGCKCKDGYVKTKNGTCICEDQCPKKQKCTGPNEYYDCGVACDNVCETLSVRNQTNCDIINLKCNEMCYCDEGYARDKNGTCVPFDQCPDKATKCGKFEVADECVNGGCYDERECDDIGNPTICARPIECKKGCLCKPGYLRDHRSRCIPREKCHNFPACGMNEIYSDCTNGGCFGAKTCEEVGKVDVKCVKLDPKDCIKGCKCKDGYVKAENGTCICEDQCPKKQKCTGPNEYYDCGVACDNVCETLSVRNQTNCDIINVKCNEMCYCDEGYARDGNGTCVPFDQCPDKVPKCGKFEVADDCVNGGCYDERECDDIGNPTICARPIKCKKGCLCKPGYLRDRKGRCIPREKCPNFPACGMNEIYSDCTNGGCFGAKTCEEVGKVDVKCVKLDPKDCIKGCKCKDGYVKAENGTCICEDQCPNKQKCTGPNEYYDCGVACDNVCETLSVRNQTNCDIINVKCNEMCYCDEGYARDGNGTCVPFDQCPDKVPKCGKFEVADDCVNGGCYDERECDDIGNPTICARPIKCKKGCLCKPGYLRDRKGHCIPREKCPNFPACGMNEIYSDCTNGGCFGAKTCEEVGKVDVKCVKLDPKDCIKGCKCKDGYVKAENGTCICEDQCSKKQKCTGPNEYYDCGVACDNVCETLSVRNQTNCDIINVKCNEMCYCDEGYARDGNGTCVPFDQCPGKAPKCGKLEVADDCVNGGCYDERECTDIGNPTICARPTKCKKGCLCKPGYLRDHRDRCIRREKCPNFGEKCENNSKEKPSSEGNKSSESKNGSSSKDD